MASPKPASSLILQDRDIAFLRGLFECRVMRLEHVSSLYFDDQAEMAKKRLQKLKAAGLVAERKRVRFGPSILYLTLAGLAELRERGILGEYPYFDLPALERRAQVSPLTIAHELEVMDVRVAFHAACRYRPTLSVAEFSTWPLLNQFKTHNRTGGEITVKPDGFIRLHEREEDGGVSEHCFFVEIDRSTEGQETLVSRAMCYVNYYKTGGFAVRHGASASAFAEYPFRVLFILKNAERRNNTTERLLDGAFPIFTQVWLTTLPQALSDPLGPIWIRPADYRKAIESGPLRSPRTSGFGYRRDVSRDRFVEAHVPKLNLLTQ